MGLILAGILFTVVLAALVAFQIYALRSILYEIAAANTSLPNVGFWGYLIAVLLVMSLLFGIWFENKGDSIADTLFGIALLCFCSIALIAAKQSRKKSE